MIFRKAQNKIQDPAKLRWLIDLIDRETWVGLDIDVKGEVYGGLLEKNAQDTKSGAGILARNAGSSSEPRPRRKICAAACAGRIFENVVGDSGLEPPTSSV